MDPSWTGQSLLLCRYIFNTSTFVWTCVPFNEEEGRVLWWNKSIWPRLILSLFLASSTTSTFSNTKSFSSAHVHTLAYPKSTIPFQPRSCAISSPTPVHQNDLLTTTLSQSKTFVILICITPCELPYSHLYFAPFSGGHLDFKDPPEQQATNIDDGPYENIYGMDHLIFHHLPIPFSTQALLWHMTCMTSQAQPWPTVWQSRFGDEAELVDSISASILFALKNFQHFAGICNAKNNLKRVSGGIGQLGWFNEFEQIKNSAQSFFVIHKLQAPLATNCKILRVFHCRFRLFFIYILWAIGRLLHSIVEHRRHRLQRSFNYYLTHTFIPFFTSSPIRHYTTSLPICPSIPSIIGRTAINFILRRNNNNSTNTPSLWGELTTARIRSEATEPLGCLLLIHSQLSTYHLHSENCRYSHCG